MFDKEKFSQILTRIISTYSSITEFAEKSGTGRSYISKYVNQKLNTPPSPKVLEKISEHSHGFTSYNELMEICGHIKLKELYKGTFSNITDDDWFKIWGDINNIYLTPKESTILAELFYKVFNAKKLDNGNFEIDFDPSFYIDSATDDFEKERIIKLFCFFMTVLYNVLKKEDLKIAIDSLLNSISSSQSKPQVHISEASSYLDDNTSFNNIFNVPVYGKIAAGEPIFASQYLEGYIPIDHVFYGIENPSDCFYLKVSRRKYE